MTDEIVATRGRPADILRNPAAREWPSDAQILDAIHTHAGILGLVAAELGVEESKLSRWIADRKPLADALAKVVASGDWLMDKHVRMGCQDGDPGYIALRLRQQQLSQQAGAGGRGPRPVDYTREVGAVEELTDQELTAILYRELLANPPPDTEECPLCHRPPTVGLEGLDV